MAIKFECPHCNQHVEAEDDWAGRELECPACSKKLTIPQPDQPGPATPPSPSAPTRGKQEDVGDDTQSGDDEAEDRPQLNGSIDAKDESGETSLHLAVREGNLIVAKALVDRGADVNAKNKCGKTPLDLAETDDLVKLLRKHGAKKGEKITTPSAIPGTELKNKVKTKPKQHPWFPWQAELSSAMLWFRLWMIPLAIIAFLVLMSAFISISRIFGPGATAPELTDMWISTIQLSSVTVKISVFFYALFFIGDLVSWLWKHIRRGEDLSPAGSSPADIPGSYNQMAETGLVLGIAGLLLLCGTGLVGLVSGILALVYSMWGMNWAKRQPQPTGKKLAVAGICLSATAILLNCVVLILFALTWSDK